MKQQLNSAALSPVWPGPCLAVPITLDCLLVGTPDQASTWAYTVMNYANLARGVVPDAPPPLTPNPNPPGPGAHLMWTLPYALRSGQQQQSGPSKGQVTFPLVPNRWVVLRIQYGAAGTAPVLSAGIVRSDLLGPMVAGTISQYPDPNNPASTLQIGGYVPIAAWTSPAGPAAPFLQAVGPGELSWAVAYDDVRNVFSFYDALPNPASGSVNYTYSVIGWYADPATDPLYLTPTDDPGTWEQAVAQKFQWSVGDTLADVQQAQTAWLAWQTAHGLTGPFNPSGLNLPPQLLQAIENWVAWQTANGVAGPSPSLPRQTLCHGMVSGVQWSGSGTSYGSGAPNEGGTVFPTVAIGNTATEAIARWMAEFVVARSHGSPTTIPIIERAVDAFQKGLLSDLQKDPEYVETLLHKARFNASSSGQVFIVVRPESDIDHPDSWSGQQSIPLNPLQTAALTALNALQAQLNQTQSQLLTQQLELFAVQYKVYNVPRNPPPAVAKAIAAALQVLQTEVQTMMTAVDTQQQNVNSALTGFTASLDGKYEVRLVDLPSNFTPNDPVVMIASANADTKFAQPGAYDSTNALFTRFTGQTITGIEVDYTGNNLPSDPQLISPADLLGVITIPLGAGIPKEIPDLWLEALFLDTSNAGLLATLYFGKRGITPPAGAVAALTTIIMGQQTAPWNDVESLGVTRLALAAGLGLQGVPPSPIAVEFRTGQPWSPIYLDWQVSWCPTSTDPAGQLTNWTLGEIDYAWNGTAVPQTATPLIFQGRNILNLKIAQDLANQIGTFQNDPDYQNLPLFLKQDLTEIAQVIGTFDIMTQSLGGFTEQLATRMVAPGQQPGAALQGNAPLSFRPVTGNVNAISPLPFFPIRSGHFLLTDLWVVDSWGQILRGKDPRLPYVTPILAQSLITPGTANRPYAQVPPRVAQAAAANLQLLDADADAILSNSSDLTTPICGWVMSNHLDQSLMVFDAAGNNQGAVLLVDTDVTAESPSGTGVRWDAAPGSYSALGAAPNLANDHLAAFTDGLLRVGLSSGGQALTDLVGSLDSSMWAIDPGSAPGNLEVLVGRPLAVVRAQLSFDLAGYPNYNQSWALTGQYYVDNSSGQPTYDPTAPPFVSVPFNFRVGDLGDSSNGVLGYFLNDDYSTFYAVYGSGTQTAGLQRALREGGRATPSLIGRHLVGNTSESGYVQWNHLIQLPPDSSKVMLTILVDPLGEIPVISGSLPVASDVLNPGPVTAALANMQVSFRVGPLLVEPSTIRMPIPAEIHGKWSWVARKDVTTWESPSDIQRQNAIAGLDAEPPRLREGWLTLTGGISK